MRLAFLLGWKDCLIRFQSRTVLVFVVVLPLAMTVITGFAFQGMEPGNLEANLSLVVEDENVSGELREALDAMVPPGAQDQQGEAPSRAPAGAQLRIVKDLTAAESRRQVASEELDGAIILPVGTAEKFAAGDPVDLELVLHENTTIAGSMVRVACDRLVEVLRQREKRQIEQKISRVGEPQRLVGFNSFSQAVAGNGVMFILLNCMTSGGIALVRERRQNTLARLLISPMTPGTIVLGKTIGVYIVGLVQAIILFSFGAIIGVFTGVNMLGVALITLFVILVGCALGLMISALARREETVEALGAPVALVLTALGGGMFPVEMAPDWLQTVSMLLPTGWAMDGYHDLIWYGGGIADVALNLLVLAGFATVFLIIGVSTLKFD
jgi:ABC-2 type transport system permease protein